MNLYLLSGNSLRNKAWIYEVKDALASQFEKVEVLAYDHWENGAPEADLDLESKKLTELVSDDTDYVVFAKSIGTVIAMKAMSERGLKPRFCIFAGLPLAMIMRGSIAWAEQAKEMRSAIFLIQNSHDPLGNYHDVSRYLTGIDAVKIIELPGDTHDYNDFANFRTIIANHSQN